jgi:hypothetical protein
LRAGWARARRFIWSLGQRAINGKAAEQRLRVRKEQSAPLLRDWKRGYGAATFRQACSMGLEGIVSKRLSAPYRSGPSRDWIKVKNPDSPAMISARKQNGEYPSRKLCRISGWGR